MRVRCCGWDWIEEEDILDGATPGEVSSLAQPVRGGLRLGCELVSVVVSPPYRDPAFRAARRGMGFIDLLDAQARTVAGAVARACQTQEAFAGRPSTSGRGTPCAVMRNFDTLFLVLHEHLQHQHQRGYEGCLEGA